MTDNEKLLYWQRGGQVSPWDLRKAPDYLNDDAAAMSLLDTLVEKNYTFTLYLELDNNKLFGCCIWEQERACWADTVAEAENKPTRREAVCAAVLEMIGKEDV